MFLLCFGRYPVSPQGSDTGSGVTQFRWRSSLRVPVVSLRPPATLNHRHAEAAFGVAPCPNAAEISKMPFPQLSSAFFKFSEDFFRIFVKNRILKQLYIIESCGKGQRGLLELRVLQTAGPPAPWDHAAGLLFCSFRHLAGPTPSSSLRPGPRNHRFRKIAGSPPVAATRTKPAKNTLC